MTAQEPAGDACIGLYDRQIAPPDRDPKEDHLLSRITTDFEEIVDEDLDDFGDERVEHAWETIKGKIFSRNALIFAFVFIIALLAFVLFVLPQIPGLKESLHKIRTEGDRKWLMVALAMEILSYVCYIAFFRGLFVRKTPLIGWQGSYLISVAGVAASRLFDAAGAGGMALTYWAVRRAGMPRRATVANLVAFYVILYGMFMLALVIDGVLLRTEVIPGSSAFGVTVVPAIFGGAVILVFVLMLLLPDKLEHLAERWSEGGGRLAALGRQLIQIPAMIGEGSRVAVQYVRSGHPGLLGALGWWVFDIATLWACFRAFGEGPPIGVLIMGYYVGQIFNILPTPGGVGPVEGGMIGAYVALGVDGAQATAAVLGYRLFAFALPTIPGAVAFIQLRKKVVEWQDELATIKSKATPPELEAEGRT